MRIECNRSRLLPGPVRRFRAREAIAAASFAAYRGIGVLKQAIGVGPVARIDRDADTGRNAQLRNVRDDERFRERRQDFFRHALGVGFAGEIR